MKIIKSIISGILFFSIINFINAQTRIFNGAYFDVEYPASFIVKPSLTTEGGYVSVFFISPDSLVEFYIFSPEWDGTPTDISLKNNEFISYKKSQNLKSNNSYPKIVDHWTIAAKDGSYFRSYQGTTEFQTVYWVVGVKYINQAALDKYKEQYLTFKSSLTQSSD